MKWQQEVKKEGQNQSKRNIRKGDWLWRIFLEKILLISILEDKLRMAKLRMEILKQMKK